MAPLSCLVVKISLLSPQMQCSDVAWHPSVATQLVLSSEVDHEPVVQLWDLRFAASPVKVSFGVVLSHLVDVRFCRVIKVYGFPLYTQKFRLNTRIHSQISQVFDKHTKGVLSVAWCQQDPDLLLSCSKTDEVFCWNPNTTPIDVSFVYLFRGKNK